ncbi:MAG: dockerin type I domain-containing protein [Pirellulaceae bacterium]|nr:dockerin type I domain-containing protein [Pirellulaceae bacterium]
MTLGAFQALEGDANGDKRIDITDFNVLSSNFDPTGQNANDWTNADFNADGNVDITDFNALSSNFAPGGYGDGPGQVPEPTSSILLGLGMLLGIGLWSRVRNY